MNIRKKKLHGRITILLTILITLLANPTNTSTEAYIIRISTDPSFKSTRLTGSVTGGTRLYIKGVGFDEETMNNQVFVGQYKCLIDNYYTSSSLLECDLPQMFYGPHKNLKVVVMVRGEVLRCRGGDCALDLEMRYTPMLYSVHPQSVFAGDEIQVRGVWKSGKFSDMRRVKVGDRNCLRTEEQDEDDKMNYHSFSSFECNVPEDMQTGDHVLTVVSTKGTGVSLSRRESFGFSIGAEKEKYNVRVHPKIENVSSNVGFVSGQILEIKGRGFGKEIENLTVQVDDVLCNVISLENTSILIEDKEIFQDVLKCELSGIPSLPTKKLFKGGAGLRNVIYDGYDKNFDKYLGEVSGKTVLSDKTMLSTENILDKDRYMQKIWGVFKAKSTGKHTFKISGDDQSRLYLSKSPLDYSTEFDPQSMLDVKCDIPRWTHFREFHKYPTQVAEVDMEKDQEYYFLAFQTEGAGRDSFTVSVVAPNVDPDALNKKPQVQKIEIVNNVVYQIMRVQVMGLSDGTFRLIFLNRNPNTGSISYYKVATLSHDVSARSFCSKVRRAIGTSMLCHRDAVDSNGNVTDESNKAGYVWTIHFQAYRTVNVLPTFDQYNATGENISFDASIMTEQTPSIYGTFKLSYQGYTTRSISYKDSWNSVKSKLEELPPLSGGVSVYHVGHPSVGRHWYVVMDSIDGNGPSLEIAENYIAGGSDDVLEKLVIHGNFEPATDEQVYLPIPSEFLRTLSSKPQVTVQVGDMFAGCENDDCDYEFIDGAHVPKISGFGVDSGSGVLSVDYTTNVQGFGELIQENVQISMGGVECEVISISESNLKCQLSMDESGNINFESGNHFPKVHLKGKGFFLVNDNVPSYDVDLIISQISPSSGSFAGGTEISILGSGFGKMSLQKKKEILINGSLCKIKEYSPTHITCTTPPASSSSRILQDSTPTIIINETQKTLNQFSYSIESTPTITSLSPNNASPVLKQTLTISGKNFSTNKDEVSVNLISVSDASVSFTCTVVSSSEDSIQCLLAGGRSGDFQVQVYVDSKGFSQPETLNADIFKFVIEIHSISPISGSSAGGTLVTLEGRNFSTVSNENQVLIGDSGRNYCVVVTSSETQIVCRMNPPQEVLTGPQDVHVLARIQEPAVCTGSCKFTFDPSITPEVHNITPLIARAHEQITIKGKGFTNSAEETEVWLDHYQINDFSVVDDTTITFSMPVVGFGSFSVKVRLNGIGDARQLFTGKLDNALEMVSVSPSRASFVGADATIRGNGFIPGQMKVFMSNRECIIDSISNVEIKCRMPRVNTKGEARAVEIVFENVDKVTQKISCPGCTYETFNTSMHLWDKEDFVTSDLSNMTFKVRGNYLDKTNEENPVTFSLDDIEILLQSSNPASFDYFANQGTVNSFGNRQVNVSFSNVVSGTYNIIFKNKILGYANSSRKVKNLVIRPQVDTPTEISSSFAGGATLTIQGRGFPGNHNMHHADIRICGQPCQMLSSEYNQMKCQTPQINTLDIQNEFKLSQPQVQEVVSVRADRNNHYKNNVLDGDINTYYYGTSDTECFIELDYGQDTTIRATKIRLFPRVHSNEKQLVGGRIQGSFDGVNYETLVTIDESVVENWNIFKPDVLNNQVWEFRFLRFYGGIKRCQIAELEVTGFKFAQLTGFDINSSFACDLNLSVVGASLENPISNIVTYNMQSTPEVTSINPVMGPTSGNTLLTINGNNFASDSEVIIDGIACQIQTQSPTEITCVTGPRPKFVPSTFEINSESIGNAAVRDVKFLYIDRWSDAKTWGGEAPPREGDSVHVPKGQVLLVDMSTPVLFAVVVEGVLMFADEGDITFDAWFVMVQGGRLEIGSPEKPYMSNLVITLHGEREGKMLPEFGNKGIFVHNGQLEMHGKPVTTTWTQLSEHGCKGDTEIYLIEHPDWKEGDQIIIAPTGRERNEVEEKVVVGVEGNKVILDSALEHDHYAGVISLDDLGKSETCKNRTQSQIGQSTPQTLNVLGDNLQSFEVRAEVGLLTRNIRIQGDESTSETGHGVHIMVRGEKDQTSARYSFIELSHAGQDSLLGKYPIHYHMMGNVQGMYVKGCSIHHTFNRGTTIHGTNYLHVFNNVYYRTVGHTIFLEDGIEENNVIEGNLVVHVSKASSLLMSDMDPAGLWQARPRNYIRDNHFVGSAGNGAWFELVGKPTGPSRVNGDGICPLGEHLLQYDRNVHHTNSLGLRVYPIYIPKTDPCMGNTNFQLRDPYSSNPGMPAHFKHNLMYMNNLGTFGKKIGAVNYIDQILISNGFNQTVAEPDKAKDSMARVLRGASIGDSPLTRFHVNENDVPRFPTIKALGLGRFSGFMVKDTTYYNFSNGSLLTTCGSCGNEKKRTPGGVRNNFENVSFVNITADLVKFRDAEYDKDILYDKTGSLIGLMDLPDDIKDNYSNGGWITPWMEHLNIPECYKQTNTKFCSSPCAVCTNDIRLKTLRHEITHNSKMFYGQDMFLLNMDTNGGVFNSNMSQETSGDLFGVNKFRNCQLSLGFRGWLSVIATGYTYNFHFGRGMDWKMMKTSNNYYWGLDGPERPTYLSHNHTKHRELFDSFFTGVDQNEEYRTGDTKVQDVSVDGINSVLGEASTFGEYYYDAGNQNITWKIDEKRIGSFESEAIYCRDHCPEQDGLSDVSPIEETVRRWSQVASWEALGRKPSVGETVVIEEHWNMILDEETPVIDHLIIKGRLEFSGDYGIPVLNAKLIEIMHGGELLAGSIENPFMTSGRINLVGGRSENQVVISSEISPRDKSILNKGKFRFYGNSSKTSWLRLSQKITPGSNTLTLDSSSHNWQQGDQIIIASSTTKHNQKELKTIASINGSTITTTTAFEFHHYGSTQTVSTEQGQLDMRAEVGNLTRNLVIESDKTDDWGASILTHSFVVIDGSEKVVEQGHLVLDGVELRNMGQRDTSNAGVDFNWLLKENVRQVVRNCSFNDGQGWAVNMFNSKGVDLVNNVIYNTRKFGVFLEKMNDVTISNNLLIGVKERDNYDNVEYFDLLVGIYYNDQTRHLDRNKIMIKGNHVSSAPWFGFAVPGYNCQKKSKEDLNFVDNVAHSCRGGWIPTKLSNQKCAQFSYFWGYKNEEQGFVQRADVDEIIVDKFILADNRNGMVVNGGNGNKYPKIWIRDSVIIGKALTDAPELYADDQCETSGLITGLFNRDPYDFYFEKTRLPMHNSTNVKFSFGGKQEINNVVFRNFETPDDCENSFGKSTAVRMNNFYQDNSNYVTFKNCVVDNVRDEDKFFFPNHKRHLDTPAYCGKRDCTANYNTLFVDIDGSFFGKQMQFFGNNRGAGQDGDCTFYEEWNGHACNPEYMQLLVTLGSNGQVVMPLVLSIEEYSEENLNSHFVNETDSPKTVTNLIKKGETTRVQTTGLMPSGMQYQLFTQNNNDWTILKVQAEDTSTMVIMKEDPFNFNGKTEVRPIIIPPGQDMDLTPYVHECGANHYDPKTRTIHFVLKGQRCKLTVEFAHSLELSTLLSIDPDTFYNSNGITTFIDRLAALLGISLDRIKVVGLESGITSETTMLQTSIRSTTFLEDDGRSESDVKVELSDLQSSIDNAINNGTVDFGVPVVTASSRIMGEGNSIDEMEYEFSQDTNVGGAGTETGGKKFNGTLMYVLISLGVSCLVGFIIMGVLWWVRKRRNKVSDLDKNNEEKVNETGVAGDKNGEFSNEVKKTNPYLVGRREYHVPNVQLKDIEKQEIKKEEK